MSTIPLQILLHGLIALVPMNDADGANHMTALLVEAGKAPAGMTMPCFAEHVPELRFTPKDTRSCEPADCDVLGDECVCTLSRQDITLSIDPPLALEKKVLGKTPQHGLPFNLGSADDFSYIANLAQQGWTLDRKFLDTVPPETLVARMSFPFQEAKACSLAVRHDEGSRNVHLLSFRPHGAVEAPGHVSQALAQQSVVLLDIPEVATVTVTLRKFGESEHNVVIRPGVDNDGILRYGIQLSNMRDHHEEVGIDDPCDDGVARDFAMFYELVENKPDWDKRPIPHVKYTRWKSFGDLEARDCLQLSHTASSRPICPMASFN